MMWHELSYSGDCMQTDRSQVQNSFVIWYFLFNIQLLTCCKIQSFYQMLCLIFSISKAVQVTRIPNLCPFNFDFLT
jgi:hypothetical protein